MANGTYFHDGEGWKPTHSRPPLRRPVVGRSDHGGLGYYSATLGGAKGNGETDDSPALNALVQTVHDAGGGTIWLPRGIYMLDSPIIWTSNVSLRGEGIGISVLKTRQAAVAVRIANMY